MSDYSWDVFLRTNNAGAPLTTKSFENHEYQRKCITATCLYFDFCYLAGAGPELSLPAKFRICHFYIWWGRGLSFPHARNLIFGVAFRILISGVGAARKMSACEITDLSF